MQPSLHVLNGRIAACERSWEESFIPAVEETPSSGGCCSPGVFCPPVPTVAPTNVSGGGGSRSELVITWEVIGNSINLSCLMGESMGAITALLKFRAFQLLAWAEPEIHPASGEETVCEIHSKFSVL